MPLDREKFIPRTYPQQDGQAGNPYVLPNGLGRYFVARDIMRNGKITTEYAKDPKGELEAEATHAVRTHAWGADDDGAWYPAPRSITDIVTFGTRKPRQEMSAETALVHIEANQREYAEAEREYNREYTIDDYPEREDDTP